MVIFSVDTKYYAILNALIIFRISESRPFEAISHFSFEKIKLGRLKRIDPGISSNGCTITFADEIDLDIKENVTYLRVPVAAYISRMKRIMFLSSI